MSSDFSNNSNYSQAMEEAVKNGLDFSDSFFVFEFCFVPFSMVINGFTFFIVIKHTPSTMKEYRKYLISVQFWMSFFELCIHLLVRPLFFFPFIANGCTGLLSRLLAVPALYQITMMMVSLCANFCGLMSTLMYRRNQMIPPGSFKLSDRQMRCLHFLGVAGNMSTCVLFYIASSDHSEPISASDPRLEYIQTIQYMVTPLVRIWFFTMFAFGAWVLIFSLIFVFSIVCQLTQMNKILSERTFEMQKNFSMTLLLQLAATLFLFLLPMGFSFVTVFLQMSNPLLQHLISYIPSFHSSIYTLILLIHTPVYLNATLVYLRIRKASLLRRPTMVEPSSCSVVKEDSGRTVKTQSLTSHIVH